MITCETFLTNVVAKNPKNHARLYELKSNATHLLFHLLDHTVTMVTTTAGGLNAHAVSSTERVLRLETPLQLKGI